MTTPTEALDFLESLPDLMYEVCGYNPVTVVTEEIERLRSENQRQAEEIEARDDKIHRQRVELHTLNVTLTNTRSLLGETEKLYRDTKSRIAELQRPPEGREGIVEREQSFRFNCGHFGHVSQEQAVQAFMDLGTLLQDAAQYRNAIEHRQQVIVGMTDAARVVNLRLVEAEKRIQQLLICCEKMQGFAAEVYKLIDNDQESKAMRLAAAMAGNLRKYRHDVDEVVDVFFPSALAAAHAAQENDNGTL